MSAGLRDHLHALQQQWPLGPLPPLPEDPPKRVWAHQVEPTIPKIAPLPVHFFVVHDASYLSMTHQAGGACAVVNAVTGDYQLHEVDVPVFVDNSYQAEVYVAWAVLCGSGSVLWGQRSRGWTFTDSKSYIQALQANNTHHCPLISFLLERCRSMTALREQPMHLYSHVQGTVLDTVLDAVDKLAGEVARRSAPMSGWLHRMEYPLVCFEVNHKVQREG